jgi:hypothetical protein
MNPITVFQAADLIYTCIVEMPEDVKSGIIAINEKLRMISFRDIDIALETVKNSGWVFSWVINKDGFIDLTLESKREMPQFFLS